MTRLPFALLSILLSTHFANAQTTIGVSTALSGNMATYGEDIRSSLEFANSVLANGKYRFSFEDDRCSGKEAVTIAQKFVRQDNVKYVLGHACSGALLAAAPIFERAKVVAITSCASAPAISQAGEYIFRTWPSDSATARQLAEFVAARHKRIGVMTEQTEFAEGFATAFEETAKTNGLELLEEKFQTEALDQRTALLKLKGLKIDGLFLNAQSEATLLNLVKQVRELGIDVPLYNEYFGAANTFLASAGSIANGLMVIDAPAIEDAVTPEGRQLYERFVARHGPIKATPLVFATTFEAFRALDQAIQSGEDVREYLQKSTFDGILGRWSFDKHGDPTAIKLVMKRVKNGRAEPLAVDP